MLYLMMFWRKKPVDDQDDVPPSVYPFETKALLVGAVVLLVVLGVVIWFVTGPPARSPYVPQTDQPR
jgi:hypothetical protein